MPSVIRDKNVGAGYTLNGQPVVVIGWNSENDSLLGVMTGWSLGIDSLWSVRAGFTTEGSRGANIVSGYQVKDAICADSTVGYLLAFPIDLMVRLGFSTGDVSGKASGLGITILGLTELAVSLLCPDSISLAALSGEIAVAKQKVCTLTGTTPEELD